MYGSSFFIGALLLSSMLILGCGEGSAPPSEPVARPSRAPDGPEPSLADWLPEGHAGLGAGSTFGEALPPGHPPVGAVAPGAGALPAGHPPIDEPQTEVSEDETVAGTVRETMDAAGYTYMQVETANGVRWVAANQTTVAVGDRVEAAGTVMHGFRSNSLDRTFDQLVLASSVVVEPRLTN